MIYDQTDFEPNHRGLLDALSEAVILIDPIRLQIIDINSQARELIGFPLNGPFEKTANTIAALPIIGIDDLDIMLSRGEGSVIVPGLSNGHVGPFFVEARSFIEDDVKITMLIIRKAEDNSSLSSELDQVTKERQALMETIADLVFSVDRSGMLISINRAVRGLGYREEEMIGANIYGFVAAGYRDVTSKMLEAMFSGEKAGHSYSLEVLAKDGEAHLLMVRGRLVNAVGIPAEVQCIARDITPMMEADKALGESLWQYKSLFEHAHIAMCEIEAIDALDFARDTEREKGLSIQEAIARNTAIMAGFMERLRFLDVNRECLDLFHARSKEDLQDWGKIFPEESLTPLSGWVGSMLVGDSGTSWECMIRTFNGEDRVVVLRWGSLSHSNGHRHILLSFIDITDKMRAFKQLEEEKRFADATIDFAESLIIGTDMEGMITIFNRKAEQCTGLKREDVLGRNYFSLFDAEVGPEAGRVWLGDMAKAKGSTERIKILPGKTASPLIWWHNTVVESGDRAVMINLGVDITERMSLNHRMEDLNNSLLLLNRILRHDIMNDLTVALGSIQLYEMKREGRFLEAATRSLTKSVDLIHDISDLDKLRTATELKSVKVRDVVNKVVANRAGQNVLIRVTGEATAMADETLSSVIDNLVGNAIMHGRTETVDIDIRTEEDRCLISVADQGKGIPDEIKARIFEEGFKFGETGNTGFGLYIVNRTMEKYGGSVVVKDNHPRGTIFELRLLLNPPK